MSLRNWHVRVSVRGRKYRGSLFAVKYIGKWKLQLAAEVTVGSGRAISKEDVA